MTDQQDPQPQGAPQDAVPVFPTMEGGAASAEAFFDSTVWNYLIVLDVTNVPVFLRETMNGYLAREAFEIVGDGNFNVWGNPESVAIRYRTTQPKMELFNGRVREIVRIWATNHFVRFNQYVMSPQD